MPPETTAPPHCLVTGATGYIGSRLVPMLLDRGMRIRVLARTPAKLEDAPWRSDVEVVQGDLTDPDSLERACGGDSDAVDVVYHLVHAMGSADDFAEAERRGAVNMADAARRNGVGRIVYLGGLHPEEARLSRHLRSRTEVGRILCESGVPTMVLQAGVVVGAGSDLPRVWFDDQAARMGAGVTSLSGGHLMLQTDPDDVAEIVNRLLTDLEDDHR